eukprot:m.62691 g.62691  ORF g.62691 m.62691 type:complete len:795 (-) comp8040_c0_seq1:342-2726(-)
MITNSNSMIAIASVIALISTCVSLGTAKYITTDLVGPIIAAEIDGIMTGNLPNYTFPVTFSGENVVLGLRFREVSIPNGAFLASCQLHFASLPSGPAVNDTTVLIQVASEANSTAFTANNFDLSARSLRQGYTAWPVEPWHGRASRDSTQLVKHLTTVFHSPSWNEGDPLLFLIKAFESSENILTPRSFQAVGGHRPFLRIDYVKLREGIAGHKSVHAFARLVNTQQGLAAIIVLFAYAIITFIFAAFSYSARRKLEDKKKPRRSSKMIFKQPSHLSIFSGNTVSGSHPLSEWEMPPSALLINKRIGSGRFGHIYEATARDLKEYGTVRAAVSILTAAEGSIEQELFFESAMNMHTYACIDHANVLKLYGVVTSSKPNMIITEYCLHGSLEETLKAAKRAESKKNKAGQAALLLSDRIKLAGDVACGMAFLSNQGFVHRSIAAKNCLVDHNYVAKIGGFDSAVFVDGKVMDSKAGPDNFPVRWMSPQSISLGYHSQKSDVWSFGILLWECVTFAELPYKEFQDNTEVCERILTGKHLGKPHHCPDSLYSLMRSCWRMSPQTRPDFEDLLASLVDLHRSYVRSEEKYATKIHGPMHGQKKSVVADSSIATFESRDNSRNQSFRSRASTFISKTFQKVATIGRKKKRDFAGPSHLRTASPAAKSIASSYTRARSISDVEGMNEVRRKHNDIAAYSIADTDINEIVDMPTGDGIAESLMRGNSDLMDSFSRQMDNEQLYFREGIQGIFFQASPEHFNNPDVQLYRKMGVPNSYQPQADNGEFWDPVDRDFMYIPFDR